MVVDEPALWDVFADVTDETGVPIGLVSDRVVLVDHNDCVVPVVETRKGHFGGLLTNV